MYVPLAAILSSHYRVNLGWGLGWVSKKSCLDKFQYIFVCGVMKKCCGGFKKNMVLMG